MDTVAAEQERMQADGREPVRVIFCCFDRKMADMYKNYLETKG